MPDIVLSYKRVNHHHYAMNQSPPTSRQRGLTLIELMVTLSIIAILLALGVPSFQRLILDQRLTGSANELLGALASSRSEAIRQNTRLRFCVAPSTLAWTLQDFASTPNVLQQGELASGTVITAVNLGTSPVAGSYCVDFRSDGLPYDKDRGLVSNGQITLTQSTLSRIIHIKTGSIYVQ
ncbi:MAG: prepilin-type N-terminal cleavage/methylation domain-containing protein [Dechloromonas sp.]|nr:MAG: prepilin-type N-terminal cleavage/methylation domain-containing protein [Dechloromonas sp.]